MIYSFLFSFRFYLAIIICTLCLSSCKSTLNNATNSKIDSAPAYVFLSKKDGELKITKDEKEGFFEKIEALDMRLQMGMENSSDSSLVKDQYLTHLENSVLDFNPEEKTVLSATLDSCMNMIYTRFPHLELPSIELIKTDANHYGPSVYYTRENAIIIPENELKNAQIGNLQAVMLHEISHILFRYNDELKTQAYGLIGFKKRNKEIKYPEALKKRMLLNPDGLDNRFYIDLSQNEKGMKVVPIIISSKKAYSDGLPGFMNYIKFDLYELEETDHILKVVSNDNGFSKLGAEYMAPFFQQIKENTQYIIHPDEIIADNFMMLLIGDRDGTLDNFSDEGQKLLEDLRKILSQ